MKDIEKKESKPFLNKTLALILPAEIYSLDIAHKNDLDLINVETYSEDQSSDE